VRAPDIQACGAISVRRIGTPAAMRVPVGRVVLEGLEMAMKRILVGVDGSPEAAAAAQKAADLAKAVRAQLTIAHVVPRRPPPGPEAYVAPRDRGDLVERHHVAALLYQAEQDCARDGLVLDSQTHTGPVAEALADAADEGDFDLVVVGHRGRGGARRTLLGSVADRLVQISHKPVLVVR
jgi:nucleotide-binding universal stress UspA family protein